MPELANIDHFAYGPITPALAYALSVLGSLLGLTCTALARTSPSRGRRAWFLGLAAWAIGGTGIWVMHFIAMLGFGVEGAEIRYDETITLVSAIIAIVVVGIGLFIAGFGRPHGLKIVVGGVFAGVGVASMHYTGMAAMRLDGTINYDPTLVGASVAIAVVAATVALWFTVTVQRAPAILGSALVMGLAVCGMHYTGMLAMDVHLHGDAATQSSGATAFALVLPIALLVIFVVIGLIYAVLAAPTEEDRAAAAFVAARMADRASTQSTQKEPEPGSLASMSSPYRNSPTPNGPTLNGSARQPGSAARQLRRR